MYEVNIYIEDKHYHRLMFRTMKEATSYMEEKESEQQLFYGSKSKLEMRKVSY